MLNVMPRHVSLYESKGEVVRRACSGAIVPVYPCITSHELGVPDYPVCTLNLKGHQQDLKLFVEGRTTCRGGRESRNTVAWGWRVSMSYQIVKGCF